MTIPAYTVYQGESPDNKPHPRLLFRHTEKAFFTGKKNSTASWKALWDDVIIPYADAKKAQTDSTVGSKSSVAMQNILILSTVGWILESGIPANGYKAKARGAALDLAAASDDVGVDKRERTLALAFAFDILYDDLTTAERDTLASEILQQCDRMSFRTDEYMDGHSGNDQMCQAFGALAIHGYGGFAAQAQQRLDEAMDFWYGGPQRTTGQARFEMPRWEKADGGVVKGGWYTYLGSWGELFMMWVLDRATSLTPWTTESAWASKVWEGLIWQHRGGSDDDREARGDMNKLSSPKFQFEHRVMYDILASKYDNPDGKQGGRQLWWLHQNNWDTYDSPAAVQKIWDYIFTDRAAIIPVLAPKDASPQASATRLFDPPGIFYHRDVQRGSGNNVWDYDQSVKFRIDGTTWHDIGHEHLGAGAVSIDFKGEPLLLSPSGLYDAYDTDHHKRWYQRSKGQSLVPLIIDPGKTYKRYQETLDNDGGQHFKKFNGVSSAGNVYNMQNDGPLDSLGKHVGWRRTSEFVKYLDDANFIFLFADILPAYRPDYLTAGPGTVIETKYLVIKPTAANGLDYPALLYYARCVKNSSSYQSLVPLHFRGTTTITSYGCHAVGEYGVGKLWVDIRNVSGYTLNLNTPGTPLDGNGYGPDQWKFRGTGTNYPPNQGANSRELADLKKNTLWVEKATGQTQDDYAMLLMLTANGASEPAATRAWGTDVAYPDHYAITIGSTTYLVSKTMRAASVGSVDTTAPGEITNVTVVAGVNKLTVEWDEPNDADYKEVDIEYRTSAIP